MSRILHRHDSHRPEQHVFSGGLGTCTVHDRVEPVKLLPVKAEAAARTCLGSFRLVRETAAWSHPVMGKFSAANSPPGMPVTAPADVYPVAADFAAHGCLVGVRHMHEVVSLPAQRVDWYFRLGGLTFVSSSSAFDDASDRGALALVDVVWPNDMPEDQPVWSARSKWEALSREHDRPSSSVLPLTAELSSPSGSVLPGVSRGR